MGRKITVFYNYPDKPLGFYGYWITLNAVNDIVNFTKRVNTTRRDYNKLTSYWESVDCFCNHSGQLIKKEVLIEEMDHKVGSGISKIYAYDAKGKLTSYELLQNTYEGCSEEDEEKIMKGLEPEVDCWWLRKK